MKKIALIGSTGSIGKQTLNVVRRNPDKFQIVSLSAGNNVELFIEQVKEFSPLVATSVKEIEDKSIFNQKTEYYFGENVFTNAIVSEADVVVVALVGFKGIIAVHDALNKNKNVALANKESLVVGGELITNLAKSKNLSIIPIDSEHSAIFQALNYDFNKDFKRIILTCSGGAFRDKTKKELNFVKAVDALKHPNWNMGAKITIDCATLVNKAFEVIEAKWLYNTTIDKIDVIIHRESVIHSMVEFCDGSTIAQMSYPSMELPIALALTYPERIKSQIDSLDFAKIGKLSFESLDKDRFPCFELVVESARRGGTFPAVANGVNDRAVKLFLENKIAYNDIYKALELALSAYNLDYNTDLDGLVLADKFAQDYVTKLFGV